MRNLIFVFLILFAGCQNKAPVQWEEICHMEGEHRSRPYRLNIGDHDELTYLWKFNSSGIYTLPGGDQYDWNKLTGLSWSTFGNHQNSAMVGWRWTCGDDIQLNAYFHIDGTRDFTEILDYVAIGEEFYTAIIVNGDGWVTVDANGRRVNRFFGECCNDDNSREIYPWFGGNRAAPQMICFERKPFSHN